MLSSERMRASKLPIGFALLLFSLNCIAVKNSMHDLTGAVVILSIKSSTGFLFGFPKPTYRFEAMRQIFPG